MRNPLVRHPSDRAAVLEWVRLRQQALFPFILILIAGSPAKAVRSPEPALPLPMVFMEAGTEAGVTHVARASHAWVRFRPGGFEVRVPQGGVGVEFAGASQVSAVGVGKSPGSANFLIGPREQWRTGLAVYEELRYPGLYPGIDAVFGTSGRLLKSEFHVQPGADPARIRLRYLEARRVAIEEDGSLRIETASGVLREGAPVAYQRDGRRLAPVPSRYQIAEDGSVGFVLGAWRRDLPLVIDPVFAYSTYLGGNNLDWAHALAIDAGGAAYVTGYTLSPDFAIASGPPQQAPQGNLDAFVVKLSPQGNTLVYWTFIGGNGPDQANAIAVDGEGNAYIAGETDSVNLPVTGGFQTSHAPGRDGFVLKLNAAGNAVVWASYLGGTDEDFASGIALDPSNNVYVAGWTFSSNFPTAAALQSTAAGGGDAFLTKISNDGASLVYSTLLGGAGNDEARSIAVDAAGAAYVAGHTNSPDFPVVGAAQSAIGGGYDAFVTKFSPGGNALAFSTFLGGSREERIFGRRALAVDSSGAVYVGGRTYSPNFPLVDPVKFVLLDVDDAFVAKLAPTGGALVFSTYLGGSGSDDVRGLALDQGGRVHVTGKTSSPNFPIVNATVGPLRGLYDVFVARLGVSGASNFWRIERGELIGGDGDDEPHALAVDAAGAVYVAGATTSLNFPLQVPFQDVNYGGQGAFVFKLANPGSPSAVSVTPSSGSGSAATFTLVYSDPDGYTDLTEASVLVSATPSTANGCWIRYTRVSHKLELATDAGTGWAGSITPGSAGTLENGQCVLNAASSSAAGNGNTLTLAVAVTFRTTFAGARNLYMDVADSSGTAAGWQARGAWTVTAGGSVPPVLVSVTPASGSGAQESFQFVYRSIYGAQDLNYLFANISPNTSGLNACLVRYGRAANILELGRDDGSGWAGQGTPGAQTWIENTQCRVNLAFTSITATAGGLTMSLSVTFKASFVGPRNVLMAALNSAGVLTGWSTMGTYTVLFNYTPVPVSAAPSSGNGLSQVFEFAYSDQNGFADIAWTAILIHASLTPLNSCLLRFTRTTNQLELANDAGAFTNILTVGFPGTIQNSQCTVDGLGSAAIIAGNNLTVRVALTFKPAYSGTKSVYMTAADNPGSVATWASRGTWTIP